MTSAAINDLPDSDFAYIEPGGTKDSDGKTIPRSKRHFPIHDEAHIRNALARLSQSEFGGKARSKVMAAARTAGIHVSDEGSHSVPGDAELREIRITSTYPDLHNPLEMRDMGSDGKWIGGYATVFMPRMSKNLGGFVERVAPHAFDEARLGGWADVVCRFNHDSNMILGTTAAGTLRTKTDNIGLDYMVLPPQARRDVTELVQRGDIRYSSFAFRVSPGGDEWGVTDQNFPLRTLHSLELVDVAPVLQPGYPDATAAMRATKGALRSLADHFQVSADEIRSLADNDELRKLFIRSDRPNKPIKRAEPPRLFGPMAAALLLRREHDPYDEDF
jgi:HK97 family phage prohead protease